MSIKWLLTEVHRHGSIPTAKSQRAQEFTEAGREDDPRPTAFGVVDHKSRDGRDERNREFVPPTNIKQVINEPKQSGRQERQQRSEIKGELRRSSAGGLGRIAAIPLTSPFGNVSLPTPSRVD